MTAPIPPGHDAVPAFAGITREYDALRERAAVLDRSARTRLLFSGAKAAETLNGLVTNDVASLTNGTGLYAAALTAKGKVIADLRVFAREDDSLVDVAPGAAAGFVAMLRKYVNPRGARFADVSGVLRTIGVYGPHSANLVTAATGAERARLLLLAPYHHLRAGDHDRVLVSRVPDLGGEGFDLFVPVEGAAALWDRLVAEGAEPAGTAVAEIARVEAGRPLWGIDMDENTLAQEANLDALHGVSYTKGCYTGQETVARVHFRGHVNRHLRGLRCDVPPPRGATLVTAAGDEVGDVRSSVWSPRFGAIAIAMVRHEVPDDSALTARWDGGDAPLRVTSLPFA
ncbi:MAG: folate-binding protein YgfZ [Gemmatimonadetes bacterium]|nr:folate-binding protein YgfZ [Gemmatimonadota bacterium]